MSFTIIKNLTGTIVETWQTYDAADRANQDEETCYIAECKKVGEDTWEVEAVQWYEPGGICRLRVSSVDEDLALKMFAAACVIEARSMAHGALAVG